MHLDALEEELLGVGGLVGVQGLGFLVSEALVLLGLET